MNLTTHEDKIRNQFGLRAPGFDQSARWITSPILISKMADAAGSPGKGLALCCGTGIVGRSLGGTGWEMTGVDITPEMVEATSRHFPATVAAVENLPFERASFDLAVMRQAYFLLGDGPRALAEVRRVLRPGGRFVLAQTVPFSEVDSPWLKKVHETKQRQMTRFFTATDLRDELVRHGFEVLSQQCVSVRESVSLWMENAPELEPERRAEVLRLVREAPDSYRRLRRVAIENGELLEDWNWVVFSTTPVSEQP